MPPPKTLQERQKELRALLASPAGRDQLEALAARYAAKGGPMRPSGTSAITYILVHERERGLIAG
jgi:hypothetical protein